MDRLKPHFSFSFNGNVGEAWKSWKKTFQFFITATETDEKSEKVKISTLLTCIDQRGREIYDTFTFTDADLSLYLKAVLEKFDKYCEPRKNTTITRHKFFTHKQNIGQSFNEFITELKTLCENCEFGTLRESLIRDMVICGVNDNKLRERFLRETEISLTKVIQLCQAAEQTKIHTKQLRYESEKLVYQISQKQNIVKRREYICHY